jgi:hypothetical protein
MVKLPDPNSFGRTPVDPAPRRARIDPGSPGTGAAEAYVRGGAAIGNALERGGQAIARSVAQQGEIGREVSRQSAAQGEAFARGGMRRGEQIARVGAAQADAIARAGAAQGAGIAQAGTRMGEAVARSGEQTARAMNRAGDYQAEATRQAGASYERGQTALAKGMQELAGSFLDIQLAHDRQEYARAITSDRISGAELEQEFERDQDYGTSAQRFQERREALRQQGAEQIRNPALRERFLNESALTSTSGRLRIEDKAFRIEADTNNAHLKATLEGYEQQAANSPDPAERKRMLDEGIAYINANQGKGYLSAVTAQETRRNWAARYSKAQFERLTPEERLDMLTTVPKNTDAIADRIIQVESGGRSNAKATTSSATGLGQYVNGTWIESIQRHRPDLMQGRSREEVLALRNDATLSREIVRKDVKFYEDFLESKGIIRPTPGQIYLAHFLGREGALAVLKSEPGTPIEAVIGGKAIGANQSVMGGGKTVDDIRAWGEKKMVGVERGTGTYLDFIPTSIHPALTQQATQEIITRNNSIATAEAEKIEGQIIDAKAGRGAMPPLQSITENPAFQLAGTQGASKVNTLKRQYDEANKDVAAFNGMAQRFMTPGPVSVNRRDPKEMKALDMIAERNGNAPWVIEQIADRAKVVPSQVQKSLLNAQDSTDPKVAGQALQMTSALMTRDGNQNIFAGSADGDKLEKNAVIFKREAELFGAEKAVQLHIERQTPEYKARIDAKMKNEEVADIIKKNVKVSDIESKLDDSTFGWRTNPTVGVTQRERNDIHQDYVTAFRDAYEDGPAKGDVENAKAIALMNLKRSHGVSKVFGGNGVFMKFAPDRAPAYDGIPNAADGIAEQAIEAIREDRGVTVDRKDLIISPLGRTGRDYEEGRPPRYHLGWRRIGADGQPVFEEIKPGTGFYADPDIMRRKITGARETAADALGARTDRILDEREINRGLGVYDTMGGFQ